MPIKRCTQDNGQPGWQWGNHGTCYGTRAGAERQAEAAYANGYREKRDALKQKGQAALDLQLTAPKDPTDP